MNFTAARSDLYCCNIVLQRVLTREISQVTQSTSRESSNETPLDLTYHPISSTKRLGIDNQLWKAWLADLFDVPKKLQRKSSTGAK